MQELLVLGLIPGTDIQITFFAWLFFVCTLIIWIMGMIAHRHRLFTALLITLLIVQETRIRQVQA